MIVPVNYVNNNTLPKRIKKNFKEILFNESNDLVIRQSKSMVDTRGVTHLNERRMDGVRPHTCSEAVTLLQHSSSGDFGFLGSAYHESLMCIV